MIVALPRCPQVSVTARDAVLRFGDQLGARRSADACLLVSELVTNAYRHGQGQIRLTITLHDHVARFAVFDEGHATLQPTARPGEHGGWGLNIVAQVADHWGTDAPPTHVWFELYTPSRPASEHLAALKLVAGGQAVARMREGSARSGLRLSVLA